LKILEKPGFLKIILHRLRASRVPGRQAGRKKRSKTNKILAFFCLKKTRGMLVHFLYLWSDSRNSFLWLVEELERNSAQGLVFPEKFS
jgi:hypothetical protein